MTFNRKHCLLFLAIFVILLVGMTMASATKVGDGNNTQGVKDNKELSTPDNYDVDKMVQSSVSKTNTDANVKKDTTSDKTDNTDITNRQTENTETTKTTINNDIKSKNINKQSLIKVLKTDGEGTFKDLQALIDNTVEGSTLTLTINYKFSPGIDDQENYNYTDGIIISRPITINGNGATIDGNNQARIFNITANNVVLDNIVFTNSKATYTEDVADGNGGAIRWTALKGLIKNCTFTSNTADTSGGAVYWNGHNGTIVNSTFSNNKATGVHNSSSEVNPTSIYGGDGGAVIWIGSNGTVYNVTFNDNIASYRGGAIFVEKSDNEEECENTSVKTSRFTNNKAGTNGGAIDWADGSSRGVLSNSNFTGNVANRSAGAVYWRGNNGTITDCNFTDNHAYGTTLNDSRNETMYPKVGDISGGNGGAVTWIGTDGFIDNSTFSQNNALHHGGAVFMRDSHNITYHNTTFIHNEAGHNGGAIDFNVGATLGIVDNCTFIDNVANRSGGAIFWNGHNGLVKYSNFTGNNATGVVNGTDRVTGLLWGGDGGAIDWRGSNGTVEYSYFTNNNATFRGGAIFVNRGSDEDHCKNTSIEYCNFTSNYAGTNGGAIDWNTGAEDGRVEYSNFTDNLADRSAGAIYWSGSNGTVTNSIFKNNTATGKNKTDPRSKNPDYYPNDGGNGGAMVWVGTIGLVDNSTFKENIAKTHGGAVYLRNSHYITFHNTTFTKNKAGNNGGALDFNKGAEYGNITNCTFTDNIANRSGGAVYWNGHYGIINSTIFKNNNATGVVNGTDATSGLTYGGNGGAVIWTGSHGYVDNSTFINNTAAYNGGAIFLQKPDDEDHCNNITVENSNFTTNYAGLNGGAISWYHDATNGSVIKSNFTNNTAKRCGGALYWRGEYGFLQDSLFKSNTALGEAREDHGQILEEDEYGGQGGAIEWIGSHAKIYNITCNNNSANQSGGAIYLTDTNNVTIQLSHFNNNSVFNNYISNPVPTGGAITVDEGAHTISILDSEFNKNKVGFIDTVNDRFYGEGGAVYFGDNCEQGLIENSTFYNNSAKANGGAVRWDGHFGKLNNNTFINNSAGWTGGALRLSGNDIIVNDSRFDENKDSANNFQTNRLWGSAIYVSGTRSNITNSNFTKNSYATEGAVYVDGNDAYLKNLIFIDNYSNTGGAIAIRGNNSYLTSSVFNKSKSLSNASAIFIEGHNATVTLSEFNNNDVTGNGTIFVLGNNTVLSYNNMTSNKLTDGNGGAIFVEGPDTTISHLNIDKHKAYRGGSIYIDGKNTRIEYSNITNSKSDNEGGAIYINGNLTTISNTNIARNNATQGGSIYIEGDYTTITASNVTDSKSTSEGGAIYINGDNTIISRSDIARNNGTQGGSIYIHGEKTTITRSNVTDSKATSEGGGIYVFGDNTIISYSDIARNNGTQGGSIYISGDYTEITDSNVTYSRATSGNGGGLYITGHYTTITGANMSFNKAPGAGAAYVTGTNTIISHCELNNNTASSSNGGALTLNGTNSSVLYSSLKSNYAYGYAGSIYIFGDNVGYVVQGCVFENSSIRYGFNQNSGLGGGAIFMEKNRNALILDNTFINCRAYKGGAINFKNTYYTLFDNCTFINCFAGSDGGSFYGGDTSGSIGCNLTNCKFINSVACKNGGSIVWNSENGLLKNNLIINSTCDSHRYNPPQEYSTGNTAGSLLLETSKNTILINNTFINSYSDKDGGIIRFRDKATNITMIDCKFINGSAKNNGGAIECETDNNIFINCSFLNCNATNGGAIYSTKLINVTNSTFKDNVAATNGGGLYLTGGANINNTNITNNNATAGSGIYLTGGTLTLNHVKLLENQAHAKEFFDPQYDDSGITISGTFQGNDNFLNGICRTGGTINYADVEYLGVDGITISDPAMQPASSFPDNEVYQVIMIELYRADNTLIYSEKNYTDANGNYKFEFDPDEFEGLSAFKIYHPEDNYYTYLAYGIVRNVTSVTVTVSNKTFTPTYSHPETIIIQVSGTGEQKPSGYVRVYLNSSLEGFKEEGYVFRRELNSNGLVIIDDEDPLGRLNASEYEVFVVYEGDDKYLSENVTTYFTIYKAESPVSIGIENYTYNGTSNISVSVDNDLGEGIYSGTVTVHVWGDDYDFGVLVDDYTYTVPIINGKMNYTEYLPILNAGEYHIHAVFSGTQNYLPSESYKNFTVYKAASVINVTAENVTSLEDSIINVHIDPEVSTGTVNITVVSENGYKHFEYYYPLSDSSCTLNLGNLNIGTYIVSVDYGGDRNHNESTNNTLFVVRDPEFKVEISLDNMTYGQNRTFTITVPTDFTGELKLYINGSEITSNNYTINRGIITFNTANLTDFKADGKLVVGEYNISVNYTASENDKYVSRNESALFNVFQAEPTITVNTVNITYGFNETITINLTSYNASGKVNITVYNETDGIVYRNYSVTLTNQTGINCVLNYTNATPGSYRVVVEYCNDTNYVNTTVTGNYKVVRPVVTISVDRPSIFVEEYVTLLGSVTDGYGAILKQGIVNLTVYNSSGFYKNFTALVNESGIYMNNTQYFANGTYTAYATYILDGIELATSINHASFVVNKIHTITNVTVLNSTVTAVTIDVVVKENETSKETEYGATSEYLDTITNGTIIVWFREKGSSVWYNKTVSFTDNSNTTIVLNSSFINTTKELDFYVEYAENWKYINSTGINSTNGVTITSFTAEPIASNLTVIVTENPEYIRNNITISGHVYTDIGEEVTSGQVSITIMQGETTILEVGTVGITENGYSKEINTTLVGVGEYTVVVKYLGNKTGDDENAKYIILESTNTTSFRVVKIPTITNVSVISSLINNVTIRVNVTNITDLGTLLKTGTINVTKIDGTSIVSDYALDPEHGYVDIVISDFNKVGTYYIKVVYNENEYYLSSSARSDTIPYDYITINVHKIPTITNVSILSTELGNVVLGVNVTNDTDYAFVQNGTIMVVNSTNNSQIYGYLEFIGDGKLTVKLTGITVAGDYVAVVSYLGTDIYEPSMGKDVTTESQFISFTVTKYPTNTTVAIIDDTVGHVVLEVNVTNSSGTPVSQGRIIVRNATDGSVLLNDTLNDGKRYVTLDVDETGIVEVTVEYLENNLYYNSTAANNTVRTDGNKNITLIVVKQNPSITISIEDDDVFVKDYVTINGTVLNATSLPYTSGSVNISINGTDYVATYNTTTGKYNLTVNATTIVGIHQFNATYYDADGVKIIGSHNLSYMVNKIPTATNVTILNTTAGNVTLNITVAGADGNRSMTGKVNITIAGNPTVIQEELVDGNVVVNLRDNITTSGVVYVTVTFNGNGWYSPSEGNNTETGEKFTQVTVTKLTPLITVAVDAVTVVNGSIVNITGNLTDEFGKNLTDRDVDIYVNGTKIGTVRTNSTGGFNITYTASILGNMIVNATFAGDTGSNAQYAGVTNHTSFEVIKLNTTLDLNVSDINYTQHELINITVNESSATGSVLVEVNRTSDNSNVFSETFTFSGDIIRIDIPDLGVGEYNVTVTYLGDGRFNGNTTNKTFKVNRFADFELNITATNITYGEDETITVTLPSDATGTVTISIDGIDIEEPTKQLSEGRAVFTIPKYTGLVVDEYTVTVTYSGNEYYIDGRTNSTDFKVSKAASNIGVSGVNISYSYDETVTISLDNTNATGYVNITIYNSSNEKVDEHNEVPMTTGTIAEIFENLQNGTYTINVTYYGDSNYNDSKASAAFDVLMQKITIRLDRPVIYVGERITIGGNVTESDGKTQVSDGYVIVRLSNGTEYLYDPISEYFDGINRQYLENGTYNASATYYLNGKQIVTSKNITFTVNRIPTNTTVRIINNTYGNVLIDIVVVENATDYHNDIKTGFINVTIGENTVQYPISGSNTTINITGQVTTTGRIDLSVVYNGSEKYVNSTGMNFSDTSSVFDHIDIVAKASNMTVVVNPVSVKINQTVEITGQVFDEYGNPITSGKVSITVDGQDPVEVDIIGGTYTLTGNRNTTRNDTITVTVSYPGLVDEAGNTIISKSTNTTAFNVEKLPTNTTVEVLNSTAGNITLNVKVKVDNETANPIRSGILNITVAGIEYQYPYNVEDDNVTIKLSDINEFKDYLISGNANVKVTFIETDEYLPSNGKDSDNNLFNKVTITPQEAKLSLDDITGKIIGDTVNITGTLKNSTGGPISNRIVYLNITGEDHLIPVKTNSTGGYSYNYTTTSVGTITVNATFTDETGFYNNVSAIKDFIVSKSPTNTTVGIVNTTLGNVTINVTVVDKDGKKVPNGTVNVYDETYTNIIATGTVVNGVVSEIKVPADATGNLNLIVEYQEDVNYLASNATNNTVGTPTYITVITVTKIPTITSVEVLNNTLGNVTIGVRVTNDTDKNVTKGNITVYGKDVNGEFTVELVTEKVLNYGLINITVPANSEGILEIVVHYNENDIYLSSEALNSSATSDRENITVINVIKPKDTITANVTPDSVMIGEEVKINGTVFYGKGTPIPNANVTIVINGEVYTTVLTGPDGNYTIPYTATTAGTNNVTVYLTNDKTVNTTTTFNVDKKPTQTVVQIVNTTVGHVTVDVNVTDKDGNPITNGTINVTVAGKTTQVNITGNTTRVQLNITVADDVQVSVEYIGNDTYASSKGINEDTGSLLENIKTNKQVSNISVVVTPEITTIGQTVTITGNLTVDGKKVAGEYVEVTIDGKTTIVRTDKNGRYTITNVTTRNGTVDVNVYYKGNSTVTNASADTDFKVTKVSTTTLVKITNNTVGNVSVDVIVKDQYNKPVTSGKLNITTPEGSVIVPVTGEVTPVKLDITRSGTVPVSVKYLENDVYINSTGLDKASYDKDPRNADTFSKITVNKLNTTITVDVTSPVKAGNSTIISGKLVDEQNRPISGAKVEIKVNDTIIKTVTTDKNGLYTLTYNDTIVGTHNVTCTYSGNNTYVGTKSTKKFTVEKVDSIITLDPIDDVPVGTDVKITGKLVDEFNNPIADATINITVDGVTYKTTTDKYGKYNVSVPTSSVAKKNVTVTYHGDNKYAGSKKDTTFNVEKIIANNKITVPEDAKVNTPVNINGTITDKNGKPIANLPVNVTVNGVTYKTTTDKNGRYNIPVNNTRSGTNIVLVTAGNDTVQVEPIIGRFNVGKISSKLTVNKTGKVLVDNPVTITGKLVDESGKPIRKANVIVNFDGIRQLVTTDANGNYKASFPTNSTGRKIVTVEYAGNETYNGAKTSTTVSIVESNETRSVKVTVDPIIGIVGEDVTLVAHVTDRYGNNVTGGNLVFKLNGRTLRMDGRFDTNKGSPMKFHVENGIVRFTMKADLYLRSGKNITASYSGTSRYKAAKSNVAIAKIIKRTARLKVTVTPGRAKQNTDIVFTATLKDVTRKAINATCITTDAIIIFKVNGVTLKDAKGNVIRVPVTSTVVNYVYHVPTGMAGIDSNRKVRNYTVEAVYENDMFYPDVRNKTAFHVDRSRVNINFVKTTVKSDKLSIKATLTDYEGKYLVGTNKICIKVNGVTYKSNGKVKYFNVKNGKVNLSGLKLDSGTKVKEVMLVTGDRQAYLSARATTTKISTR